jgi:hypothetical protein
MSAAARWPLEVAHDAMETRRNVTGRHYVIIGIGRVTVEEALDAIDQATNDAGRRVA